MRKFPATNPQKAGSQTQTQVQFLPVLLWAQLCWDSQDLNIPCAFSPKGTHECQSHHPIPRALISHPVQTAPAAAQPCAHREYK